MKENFNLSDLSVRCSGQTGARMKKYMVAKYIRLSMEDLDLCNSEEKAEKFHRYLYRARRRISGSRNQGICG